MRSSPALYPNDINLINRLHHSLSPSFLPFPSHSSVTSLIVVSIIHHLLLAPLLDITCALISACIDQFSEKLRLLVELFDFDHDRFLNLTELRDLLACLSRVLYGFKYVRVRVRVRIFDPVEAMVYPIHTAHPSNQKYTIPNSLPYTTSSLLLVPRYFKTLIGIEEVESVVLRALTDMEVAYKSRLRGLNLFEAKG